MQQQPFTVHVCHSAKPVHRELLFPSGESRPLVRGFAAVIRHVLDAAREWYGAPLHVILSHSVMWSEQQRAVLAEAAVAAGCRSASLVGEAAAVGMFAARRRAEQLGEGTAPCSTSSATSRCARPAGTSSPPGRGTRWRAVPCSSASVRPRGPDCTSPRSPRGTWWSVRTRSRR
ncbi:hypothetical protein DDV98_27810 [Streptomyces sp. IB2014 011-12]|nr:hypothetical protein DDV98_27810 [Streptomyces sp. IB2014 011-12]